MKSKKLVNLIIIALIIALIMVDLGILCFFKYSNFFIENVNNIFNLDINLLSIALPIGISFYTFQTMSYTIDVYLEKVETHKLKKKLKYLHQKLQFSKLVKH